MIVNVADLIVDDALNPRQASSMSQSDQTFGTEEAGIVELAESLRALGQLQNIGVDRCPLSGKWRVRFGFRRVKAAKLIGLETLTAIECRHPREEAIAENTVRKRLSGFEAVLAMRSLLLETPRLTQEQIGKRIGFSLSSVRSYAQIAIGLEPSVLLTWKKRPGAFKAGDMLHVSRMGAQEQIEWLLTQYGNEKEPEESTIEERRALPSRADGERLRAKIEAGRIERWPGWDDGALEVLAYWLNGVEIERVLTIDCNTRTTGDGGNDE